MASSIDSLYQLLLTAEAIFCDYLLTRAESTEHRDPFGFLVRSDRAQDMAIVAAKYSPTATVSKPSEAKLVMFASTF